MKIFPVLALALLVWSSPAAAAPADGEQEFDTKGGFLRFAESKMNRLSERFEKIRGMEGASGAESALKKAEQAEYKARKQVELLRDITNGHWNQEREKAEQLMRAFEADFIAARNQVLAPEEAERWEKEMAREDLTHRIEELNKMLDEAEGEAKFRMENRIALLEDRRDALKLELPLVRPVADQPVRTAAERDVRETGIRYERAQ